MHVRRALVVVAVALAAVAPMAACGSSSSSGSSPSASTSAAALIVADPWTKAAASGMTAAFATLTNPGATEVAVVSATTNASGKTELHEVVMKDGSAVMQPKAGGFVVPAGGSLTLKPGGDHIMMMGLTTPVEPGDVVTVTLTLSTGGTVAFDAVAKEFSGGSETYRPSPGASTSMSMG